MEFKERKTDQAESKHYPKYKKRWKNILSEAQKVKISSDSLLPAKY